MSQVGQLLKESEKRLHDMVKIIQQSSEEGSSTLLHYSEPLLKISRNLDAIWASQEKESAAIERCRVAFAQASEPWNFNVEERFQEELRAIGNEKSKKKQDSSHANLKKHIDEMAQGEGPMETVVQSQATGSSTQLDPWTKMPIEHPIMSSVCKHFYEKKSIQCILRNRPQARCPYVGCNNVITKNQLVELNE